MTRPVKAETRYAVIAAALALAGCEVIQPQPETVPPRSQSAPPPAAAVVVPARAAPAAPAAEPGPDRPGLTLQEYQKEIATAIARGNVEQTFTGKLPPLLRSVVVLQVSIDNRGMPERVTMFRSNGFVELEKSAIAAVYRGAPYPVPGRSLLAGHSSIIFTESFLFRNDGRFQVRTVAEEQSTVVEPRPSGRSSGAKPPAAAK